MTPINEVHLTGWLGNEPLTNQSVDPTTTLWVMKFSICTKENYKTLRGESMAKTEWHNIDIYGATLITPLLDTLHKGDKVYIKGRLMTRSYISKDGTKIYSTSIETKHIEILPAEKS